MTIECTTHEIDIIETAWRWLERASNNHMMYWQDPDGWTCDDWWHSLDSMEGVPGQRDE